MKTTHAPDGVSPHRQRLRNFRQRPCALNLPRIPQANINGSCMPAYLSAGGVVPPGPASPVFDMSREIIRLSIPIGTIAISSVAVFAFSWVGLALLGF